MRRNRRVRFGDRIRTCLVAVRPEHPNSNNSSQLLVPPIPLGEKENSKLENPLSQLAHSNKIPNQHAQNIVRNRQNKSIQPMRIRAASSPKWRGPNVRSRELL